MQSIAFQGMPGAREATTRTILGKTLQRLTAPTAAFFEHKLEESKCYIKWTMITFQRLPDAWKAITEIMSLGKIVRRWSVQPQSSLNTT